MAQASTIKFGKFLIEVSSMATVPVFAAPCGFETIEMQVNTDTNNSNIPDCSDPDLVSWIVSDEVSKQMVLTGEGFLDTSAWKTVWRPWSIDGGEKNVRCHFNLTSANGGGYFQAPALLTDFRASGSRGNRLRFNITLTLNGKPSWTDAT